MTVRLLIVAVAALAILPGCGGSSSEIQVTAAQYRPAAQPAATYASRQGWKKGDEPNAVPNIEESGGEETGTGGETVDPGEGSETTNVTDPAPGDIRTIASNDPDTGTTGTPTEPVEPDPTPDPDPMTDPEPSGLEPGDPLPPTHELLAGRWRGEPKHFVVEKEEWVQDDELFIVEFREVVNAEGATVHAVQIAAEVEGVLRKQEPVEYRLDEVRNVALFGLGNQSVTIRIVAKDRIEVRGQDKGFTVVRYFKRILG